MTVITSRFSDSRLSILNQQYRAGHKLKWKLTRHWGVLAYSVHMHALRNIICRK